MASGLRAWLVVTGLALAEGQVFLVLNAGSTCLPWRGLFSLTSDRPPACCLYPGHVAWAVQIFFFLPVSSLVASPAVTLFLVVNQDPFQFWETLHYPLSLQEWLPM